MNAVTNNYVTKEYVTNEYITNVTERVDQTPPELVTINLRYDLQGYRRLDGSKINLVHTGGATFTLDTLAYASGEGYIVYTTQSALLSNYEYRFAVVSAQPFYSESSTTDRLTARLWRCEPFRISVTTPSANGNSAYFFDVTRKAGGAALDLVLGNLPQL